MASSVLVETTFPCLPALRLQHCTPRKGSKAAQALAADATQDRQQKVGDASAFLVAA